MVKRIVLSEDVVKRAAVPAGVTRSGKPQKDVVIRDAEVTGFCVRVTSTGARIFFAEYTAPAGKRRQRIGEWGQLTVKQARAQARVILGAAAGGGDPFGERQATERAERARAAEKLYTLAKLISAWEQGRADQGRRASYLAIASGAMRRHLADWLDKPATSVTTAEAVRRLDHVKGSAGPTAANRLLSYTRATYQWAAKRQLLTANPFAGLEAPGASTARDRVLDMDEIAEIWRAADTLAPTYSGFVRLLLLTLARREEVAAMQWPEVTRDTWLLPAERSKNAKAHIVHLAAPALEILRQQPRIAGCPFVFPGDGLRGPIKGYSYAKRKLEAAIEDARANVGIEPVKLADWTYHDFRRSGVTALADMGFPPHVCDRLLNHITGSIQGVAAVYQRAQFLPERKAALDAWAKHVLAAVAGNATPGNVVALRSGVPA